MPRSSRNRRRNEAQESAPRKLPVKVLSLLVVALLAGAWFYYDHLQQIKEKRRSFQTLRLEAEDYVGAGKKDLEQSLQYLHTLQEAEQDAFAEICLEFYVAYHEQLQDAVENNAVRTQLSKALSLEESDIDAALTSIQSHPIDILEWKEIRKKLLLEQYSVPLLRKIRQSDLGQLSQRLPAFKSEAGALDALTVVGKEMEAELAQSLAEERVSAMQAQELLSVLESTENKLHIELAKADVLGVDDKFLSRKRDLLKQTLLNSIVKDYKFIDDATELNKYELRDLTAMLEDENNKTYTLMHVYARLSGDEARLQRWRQSIKAAICDSIARYYEAFDFNSLTEAELSSALHDDENKHVQHRALYLRHGSGEALSNQWKKSFAQALLAKLTQRLENHALNLNEESEKTLTQMLEADEAHQWTKDVAVFQSLGGQQAVIDTWQKQIRDALLTQIKQSLADLERKEFLLTLTDADAQAIMQGPDNTYFASIQKFQKYGGSKEQVERWHNGIRQVLAEHIKSQLSLNTLDESFKQTSMRDIYAALDAGVLNDIKTYSAYANNSDFEKSWKKSLILGITQRFSNVSTQQQMSADEFLAYEQVLRYFKKKTLSKSIYSNWYAKFSAHISGKNIGMQIGTHESDSITAVQYIADGSMLLSGNTESNLAGDGFGAQDIYLMHYGADKQIMMQTQIGSSAEDSLAGAYRDEMGFIYLAGTCGAKLAGRYKGESDIFIMKLNAQAKVVWKLQLGTKGHDVANAMTVDALGNVYVAGSTTGDLYEKNKGLKDAVLIKIKADGTFEWGKQFGSEFNDALNAMCVHANQVCIGGTSSGALFAPLKGRRGDVDIICLAFNELGEQQWAKQFGSAGEEQISAIDCDEHGYIYVAGHTLGALHGTKQSRSSDMFVQSLTASGEQRWARQWGYKMAAGKLYDIELNADQILLASSVGKNAVLYSLHKNGQEQWRKTVKTSEQDFGYALAAASDGVIFAGITTGSLFRSLPGKEDIFVIKFDAYNKSILDYQQLLRELQ